MRVLGGLTRYWTDSGVYSTMAPTKTRHARRNRRLHEEKLGQIRTRMPKNLTLPGTSRSTISQTGRVKMTGLRSSRTRETPSKRERSQTTDSHKRMRPSTESPPPRVKRVSNNLRKQYRMGLLRSLRSTSSRRFWLVRSFPPLVGKPC